MLESKGIAVLRKLDRGRSDTVLGSLAVVGLLFLLLTAYVQCLL